MTRSGDVCSCISLSVGAMEIRRREKAGGNEGQGQRTWEQESKSENGKRLNEGWDACSTKDVGSQVAGRRSRCLAEVKPRAAVPAPALTFAPFID